MPELITIYDLARNCGYFFTPEDDEEWLNNGYCCSHPKNTEAPGECHTFSCPLACEADIEDMLRLDPKLAEEYVEQHERMGFIESDWMVYGPNGETEVADDA